MHVSIITVAFNSGRTIRDTILSIESQNHAEREHIIIDGGSSDDTMEVIERTAPTQTKVISEPDRGIYDAMNKGINYAQGEIIGFLNSDDIYADCNSLSEIAAVFNDPAIEVVHGNLVYVNSENPQQIVRYWRATEFSPGAFSLAWCPAHPTFYVRKSVFYKVGVFSLKYKVASDLDFMLRVLEVHRCRSVIIPKTLIRMRTGGISNRSVTGVLGQNREVISAIRENQCRVNIWVFIVAKLYRRISQYLEGRGAYK